MVQGLLAVAIEGSLLLFFIGAALHLFATTSMGIFMGTLARSMPQFGLLMMLVLLPLQMLSGGVTPRESMPVFVQTVMEAGTDHPFCRPVAGYFIPRCRNRCGLAPVYCADPDRCDPVFAGPFPLSQDHLLDGLSMGE